MVAAPFGIRALRHSRPSAFAPFGIRALRHSRPSAFAPFGIRALRHSRPSAFAPFGIRARRHSRPSAVRALRYSRIPKTPQALRLVAFGHWARSRRSCLARRHWNSASYRSAAGIYSEKRDVCRYYFEFVRSGMLLYGADRDRTGDLCSAIAALSQLSYSPALVTTPARADRRTMEKAPPTAGPLPTSCKPRERLVIRQLDGPPAAKVTNRPKTRGNFVAMFSSLRATDVIAAADRIRPLIKRTPLVRSDRAQRRGRWRRVPQARERTDHRIVQAARRAQRARDAPARRSRARRRRVVGRQSRTRRRVRGEALRRAGHDLRARAPRRR